MQAAATGTYSTFRNADAPLLEGPGRVERLSSGTLRWSLYGGCAAASLLGVSLFGVGAIGFAAKWPVERNVTLMTFGGVLLGFGVWQGINICIEKGGRYATFHRAEAAVERGTEAFRDELISWLEKVKTAIEEKTDIPIPAITDTTAHQASTELYTKLLQIAQDSKSLRNNATYYTSLQKTCNQITEFLDEFKTFTAESNEALRKKLPQGIPSTPRLQGWGKKIEGPATSQTILERVNATFFNLFTQLQVLQFYIEQLQDASDQTSAAQKDAMVAGATESRNTANNQSAKKQSTLSMQLRASTQCVEALMSLIQSLGEEHKELKTHAASAKQSSDEEIKRLMGLLRADGLSL